jgi:hypothetical protein
MAGFLPPQRRAATSLLAALAIVAAPAAAQAQGWLRAHYTITMTGITIGHVVWLVDIGDKTYSASANGKASGVLSMLVNGEGVVATHGIVANGRLNPSYFTSDITDDDGAISLRMNFAGGTVTETIAPEPPRRPGRLPVSEADRRGVTDPLSAVLLAEKPDAAALAPAACDRLLPIYDGRRRYNLALFYNRVEKFTAARGYSGPALVCGVVLEPIAGYLADSLLVKYVAGKRDMELWFAPIAGTGIIAPVRVVMPTLIGTLKIQADLFESQGVAKTPAGPALR